MELTVVLKESEEGFAIWCPGLPGCWSQGASEEEALLNIEDAIREYLLTQRDIAARETGAQLRHITLSGIA